MRGGHQTTSNNRIVFARYRDSDLHQLNVKSNHQTIQISDTEYGATSCQRRTEPAEQQPATSAFPNQMIEQINIALEQKGSGNFSAWVIEACRRRLTSEKRAYTSIKSDEEWTSRVLPSEQDDIVNSLNYEGIAVIELRSFTTFLTVTDFTCWLCHRLNSLND